MFLRGCPYTTDDSSVTVAIDCKEAGAKPIRFQGLVYPDLVGQLLTGEHAEPIRVRFEMVGGMMRTPRKERPQLEFGGYETAWQRTVLYLAYKRAGDMPYQGRLHYEEDDLAVLPLHTWIALDVEKTPCLHWHIDKAQQLYYEQQALCLLLILPILPRPLVRIVQDYCHSLPHSCS